jgi:hypothetical protein
LVKNIKNDIKILKNNKFHPTAEELSKRPESKISQHDDLLLYGNYFTQLSPFFEVFNKSEIYFLDGHQMANDKAQSEAREFEKYLGVDNEMQFKFNETKEFMCLDKPVQFCLNGAKGRKYTIDVKEELKPEIEILREYFKPEMVEMFKILMPNINIDSFCLNPGRFEWIKIYVCLD